MLRGDLATTPLDAVLSDLAATAATGCLYLRLRDGHLYNGDLYNGDLYDDAADEEARVYLRGGCVCAAFLPGWTSRLGNRLVSLGLLPPDALAAILRTQRGELIDWQLAELLVNLGYIAADITEDAVVPAALEELHDAVTRLSQCRSGRWRFRRNQRCRPALSRGGVPPQPVGDVLTEVARRNRVLAELAPVVGSLDAIPALSAGAAPDTLSLDRLTWALLCKVDGSRSARALAFDCGLSRWEAARTIAPLVEHGVLDVVDVVSADSTGTDHDDADGEAARLASVGGTRAAISAIAAALAGFGPARPGDQEATPAAGRDDPVAASLARLSEALCPAEASHADITGMPVELAAVVDLASRRITSATRGSEPHGETLSGTEPGLDEIPRDEIPTDEAGDEPADHDLLSEAFLELAAAQLAQPAQPAQPAQRDVEPAPGEPESAGIPWDVAPAGDCLPAGEGQEIRLPGTA